MDFEAAGYRQWGAKRQDDLTDATRWAIEQKVAPADRICIHGKADWRADFEQAERMKAALEKHDKQLEWVEIKREGHGVYDEETRRDVYERILGFLGKHLMVQQPSGSQ